MPIRKEEPAKTTTVFEIPDKPEQEAPEVVEDYGQEPQNNEAEELRFTDEELGRMETKDLLALLKDAYNVNPSDEGGKNTNKKLREMVARTQALHDQHTRPIPKGDKSKYLHGVARTAPLPSPSTAKVSRPAGSIPIAESFTPPQNHYGQQPVSSIEQRRTVSYEVGATIATAQFENMKVTAKIELPIDPTPAEIEAAEKAVLVAKNSVFKIINQDIAEIRNAR